MDSNPHDRDWLFEIHEISTQSPSKFEATRVARVPGDMSLAGLFHEQGSKSYTAVFIRQGETDVERVEREHRETLQSQFMAASEFYGVHPAQLTQEQLEEFINGTEDVDFERDTSGDMAELDEETAELLREFMGEDAPADDGDEDAEAAAEAQAEADIASAEAEDEEDDLG